MTDAVTAGDRVLARVLRFADHPVEAWRNGGGRTRVIAASPEGAATDAFAWRLSIADVEADGPFSLLDGVDRVIILCDGPGMHLTVDGAGHDLIPFQPVRFPGDSTTSCRVRTPTRDLNVMTRRGVCTADVAVLTTPARLVAAPHDTATFAVVLSGNAAVTPPDGSPIALQPLDALRLVAGEACGLDGEGQLALVRIRPDAA